MADLVENWRAHSSLAILLAVLGALLLRAEANPESKTLEVGGSVTLVAKYTGDPSEITWKINGNILVEMELELKSRFKILSSSLPDRATVSLTNGNLTIRNLTTRDSGVYTAEAIVKGVDQNTEIRLIVINCPAQPTISDQSTKDRIVLRCESSTPGVTYEWQNNGKSVGTNQLYNESRPEQDVTLTCIVDNEVCKKNSTRTILYTPEPSGLSGVVIVLIVILVLVIIIIIMGLCYCFQDRPYVQPIYTCLTCCKNHYMILLFGGAYRLITCCRQGRDSDNKTGTESELPGMAGDGSMMGSVSDSLTELEGCITVKFPTDAMCLVDESRGLLEDHLKRNQCLTIHGVKPADCGDYIAEALLSNGKKCIFTIKETKGDDDVIIKPEGDRVTLTVPNTEKVTKLDWKKGGVTLFEWAVSNIKFHTNNISLEPGSVTVNNAEGKGSYKVNFQLEESPESQSVGSVTFHPIKMTGKTQITWKKDGQPVNIGGNRIQPGPDGDLTINNVTSEDKCKYTVQCNDKNLNQEFILRL